MSTRQDRWWITDPIGHRRFANEARPPEGATINTAFGEAVVIYSPAPDDLYICDMCNAQMEVVNEDTGLPIWAKFFAGYVLCDDCAAPHIEALGRWPDYACGCPACQAEVKRITIMFGGH